MLDLNDGHSATWGADLMRFSELAAIGRYAPELEVLRLVMATGVPYQAATESIPTPAAFLSEPMTELPRLKEFGIDGLVKRHVWQAAPRYATTSTTNRIISWLLAAMPKVESFEFGHGETCMSQKEQKIYQAPTLPGIGGGDGPMALLWPPTLKTLRLDTLILEKDTFKSVHLPALEMLQLKGAGPHMMEIIDGMKTTHDHLQVGVCKNNGGIGQTDYHKRNKYLHGVCLTNMELPHLLDPERPQMVYKPLDDESDEESE